MICSKHHFENKFHVLKFRHKIMFLPTYSISKLNLEKAMAPHSSILVWKIPWTEEAGGLQSMGSLRVGHDVESSAFI